MADLHQRTGRFTRACVFLLFLTFAVLALLLEFAKVQVAYLEAVKPVAPATQVVIQRDPLPPKPKRSPGLTPTRVMPVGELTAWWEAWDECRGEHCID